MNDVTQSRTASVLSILVGGWLVASPIWISITGAALVSLLVVAGVMVVFGLVQLFTESSLPSWAVAIAAVWLFISAFTYNVSNSVQWNEVISGVVAFLLATWDATEVTNVQHRRHGTA